MASTERKFADWHWAAMESPPRDQWPSSFVDLRTSISGRFGTYVLVAVVARYLSCQENLFPDGAGSKTIIDCTLV